MVMFMRISMIQVSRIQTDSDFSIEFFYDDICITHAVGFLTFMMTSSLTILSNSSLTFDFDACAILRGG